jgi:hypothetical protein
MATITITDVARRARVSTTTVSWVMTDTCSAIGQTMPKVTKVVALDSAKQAHYLPSPSWIRIRCRSSRPATG